MAGVQGLLDRRLRTLRPRQARRRGRLRLLAPPAPDHQGEDAAAQLAVLERHGGAGIVPSGAYHLEVPTTVVDRRVEAWEVTLRD
ncbi:hypothetical protein Phou_070120 [Phytohabitans houttuyneae]|uniref:Uncharacterized protein n=1 Tax=Phytohabitans houttuyneae TaxID=1076126 RepID=A0A6V8KC71_9ACTN|nr:hypothetical protein Phou_070120 [Phytohabitans houttuyneae]